jgi:hypothetical protein
MKKYTAVWGPPHYECVMTSEEVADLHQDTREGEKMQQDVTVDATEKDVTLCNNACVEMRKCYNTYI